MASLDETMDAIDAKLDEIRTQLALLAEKIPSWWQSQVSVLGWLAVMIAALVILTYFKILVQ